MRPSRITHGRLSRVRPSSCARASSRATRRPSGEKTRRALCELERARAASRYVERRARGAHRAGKTAGPDWSASPRGYSSSSMIRFYTTRVSGVSFLCIGSPVIHDDGTRRRTMRDSRRSPRARWRSEKICGRARSRAGRPVGTRRRRVGSIVRRRGSDGCVDVGWRLKWNVRDFGRARVDRAGKQDQESEGDHGEGERRARVVHGRDVILGSELGRALREHDVDGPG